MHDMHGQAVNLKLDDCLLLLSCIRASGSIGDGGVRVFMHEASK
jgi:hypothetical protein